MTLVDKKLLISIWKLILKFYTATWKQILKW